MPSLLGDKAAQWLRERMDSGDWKTVPRRLRQTGAQTFLHPWKITVAPDPEEEGAFRVSVRAGEVSWGGGLNAIWPGGEIGTIREGENRLVVWHTKTAAVPLFNDPRFPDGKGIPECKCEDCDCRDLHGDPDAGSASAGEVTLEEEGWERPEGATDCRIVGAVSIDNGSASVRQELLSAITVRAIIRDGEEPGEDPEKDPPPCGNPLNKEGRDDTNPVGGGGGGGGGSGGEGSPPEDRERHPLDYPGDGGYTPTCKDENGETEY